MNETNKQKFQFPFLEIGQFLALINIVSDVFTTRSTKVQWLVYPAVVLFVLVLVLWPWSMLALRKYGRISASGSFLATTRLVDRGIYGVVRHPQYLGIVLLNITLLLLNQNWITASISLVSSLLLIFGIGEEEVILKKQFGEAYNSYCQRVPAFNIVKGFMLKLKK